MPGPLAGVRVVEIAALGPVPFAGMLLADLGADIVRIDRLGSVSEHGEEPPPEVIGRGRRSIALDLKVADGVALALELISRSDIALEGFRPGVAERLGLGPAECLARNPALVYGRMTGWGQDGPLAPTAGHDLTYLAISGALNGSRRSGQRPVPPMNLLGDFGGGALYLALGVIAALYERRTSGAGQVVDAAIVDGVASLQNFILGLRAQGQWQAAPGGNLLDTGAPFYDVYACADGREIAVAALEPQFYAELVRLSGMQSEATDAAHRGNPESWPAGHREWAALFRTRTRDEWTDLFSGSDACVAPVLSLDEAMVHPHAVARGTFVRRHDIDQAVPAPRFSRTRPALDRPPPWAGEHSSEILAELGFDAQRIADYQARSIVN